MAGSAFLPAVGLLTLPSFAVVADWTKPDDLGGKTTHHYVLAENGSNLLVGAEDNRIDGTRYPNVYHVPFASLSCFKVASDGFDGTLVTFGSRDGTIHWERASIFTSNSQETQTPDTTLSPPSFSIDVDHPHVSVLDALDGLLTRHAWNGRLTDDGKCP